MSSKHLFQSSRVCAFALTAFACLGLVACAAQTDPARHVTATTARLAAHGHTDSSPAHFFFEYAPESVPLGSSDDFRTRVRDAPADLHGPGGADLPFSDRVTGLRPNTAYHFRVCGGDAQIKPDVCAGSQSFTTAAGAPAVDFGSPVLQLSDVEPPTSLAVADFNGDGNPDVAYGTASFNSPGLAVALEDGTGRPERVVRIDLPVDTFGEEERIQVAAGDFNRDGNADVAVGGVGGRIIVFDGDGSGGFVEGAHVDVGGPIFQLVADSLGHRGAPDLVAIVHGESGLGFLYFDEFDSTAHAAVLFGDGKAGFSTPVAFDAAESPVSLAIADLNRDGKADLVVETISPEGVSVLLGRGGGRFRAPRHFSAPISPSEVDPSVVAADLTGDGRPDVAIPGSLLAGDGRGDLGAPRAIPNSPAGELAVGDLNGDGRPDLVGGRESRTEFRSTIRVLLGERRGRFSTPNDFLLDDQGPGGPGQVSLSQIALADLNHDSKPDLISAGLVTDLGSEESLGLSFVQLNTTAP